MLFSWSPFVAVVFVGLMHEFRIDKGKESFALPLSLSICPEQA